MRRSRALSSSLPDMVVSVGKITLAHPADLRHVRRPGCYIWAERSHVGDTLQTSDALQTRRRVSEPHALVSSLSLTSTSS